MSPDVSQQNNITEASRTSAPIVERGAHAGSTRMRVRARLINLIGEELISDEPVAVVELVKNAYDADATRVEVRFEGSDPTHPSRLVVEDDGIGMDIETVLDGWLEPGTIAKRREIHSPGGRLYQGAKGIGRFAAARLGDSLLLETRRRGQDKVVYVLLNWGKFDETRYLDEIEIDYEVRKDPSVSYGTKLTIEGQRTGEWNETNFERLHQRLSRMISPFRDISDFEVILQVPGWPDLSGTVEPPELVLKPRYLLAGRLNSAGVFNGHIAFDSKSVPVSQLLARGNEPPLCGPFQVEIRAWDRDREGLAPIASRENMAISQIRKTLDAFCGVSIYRDGFRVHPYGERGNDWLNLDLRSRQNPVRNLANNQIIGAVRISRDENSELRDRSTREGLVQNAAYEALFDWFRRVITLLEEHRYHLRPRQKTPTRGDQLFEAFDLTSAVRETRTALGASHPIAKLVVEAERQVSEGVEKVQEVFTRLLMSAGLGHMVDIVIHEIGAPLGKIARQLAILERQLAKMLSDEQALELAQSFSAIRGWIEQIHVLRQRLDPQTPGRRGRATSFDVGEEITLTFELYSALIQKQGIKVSIKKPSEPVRARMSKAVLSQVLANLVDNAVYWIIEKRGQGKGGRINAVLQKVEHGFSIRISDDGRGVPAKDRDAIFEPYFSTKPNGIGLGLYIARLVIEPYGRLIYRPDGRLPGACFEARFEKGVGL
jgi:signal transduction histidine kinase